MTDVSASVVYIGFSDRRREGRHLSVVPHFEGLYARCGEALVATSSAGEFRAVAPAINCPACRSTAGPNSLEPVRQARAARSGGVGALPR